MTIENVVAIASIGVSMVVAFHFGGWWGLAGWFGFTLWLGMKFDRNLQKAKETLRVL